MTRSIHLHPTGQEQQYRDDTGSLWVLNISGKPGSNPPETNYCDVCGGPLGAVTYMKQRMLGTVACADCVEIVTDQNSQAVTRESERRIAAASGER